MNRELADLVRTRGRSRCEYCHVTQDYENVVLEIDHVYAIFHGGATSSGNLAIACYHCNSFKGCNLAGIDPATRRITILFHPRRHRWAKHFVWDGPVLIGRTDIGRTTVATLRMNYHDRIGVRLEMIDAGISID